MGYTICTSCVDKYVIIDNLCVPRANPPSGTFYNAQTQRYESCNISCVECIGPKTTDCTLCKTGQELKATGECVKKEIILPDCGDRRAYPTLNGCKCYS